MNLVLRCNAVNNRILKIRIQAKPVNIRVIQIYAPTSLADDDDIETLYNTLQDTLHDIPKSDMKILMSDYNAKVGK